VPQCQVVVNALLDLSPPVGAEIGLIEARKNKHDIFPDVFAFEAYPKFAEHFCEILLGHYHYYRR